MVAVGIPEQPTATLGLNAAETFTFERRVEDGLLDIEFIHRDDNPKISAFEITRVR